VFNELESVNTMLFLVAGQSRFTKPLARSDAIGIFRSKHSLDCFPTVHDMGCSWCGCATQLSALEVVECHEKQDINEPSRNMSEIDYMGSGIWDRIQLAM